MNNLTDTMITNQLQNIYNSPGNSDIRMIILLVLIVAAMIYGIYATKESSTKWLFLFYLILIPGMLIFLIFNDINLKEGIKQDDWIVQTDIVTEMGIGRNRNGTPVYYMILNKHGRVGLDDHREYNQYEQGKEVYIILVKFGGSYKKVGITYPADKYTYTGERLTTK